MNHGDTEGALNNTDIPPSEGIEAKPVDGGQGSSRYRWYVLLLLSVVGAFAYIDRQILSLMVGPLQRDLGINDTQIGALMGLVFVASYTLLTFPMARLADRYNRSFIIMMGILVWSITSAAGGLARSFTQLAILRSLVGAGESVFRPATTSMISDYFPKDKLPMALGIIGSAPMLGIALASIIGGQVIEHFEASPLTLPVLGEMKSWQVLFFIVGLPGILLALLMLTVKEPKRLGLSAELAKSGKKGVPLRQVMQFMLERWHFFVLYFVGLLCFVTISWGLQTWNVEFLVRVHGLTKADAGLTFGLIAIAFGITGSIFGGWLASYLMSKNIPDATVRLMRWGALGIWPFATIMPLLSAEWTWLVIAMLCPMSFMMVMPGGLGSAALQLFVPNQLRAQVIALYLICVNFLAYAIGPFMVGLVSDMFGGGANIKYGIASLAFILYPLAALCLTLSLRPFRDAIEKAKAWS